MRAEAKVGIFVVAGLVALFALTTRINSFSKLGKEGYEISAYYSNISGLDKNAKVKIGGVEVGYVKEIGLEGNKPKMKLFLYKGVNIPQNSAISLKQESLLGSKFVEIVPSAEESFIAAGGTITKQQRFANFDETANSINDAATEIKSFVAELRTTFDPKTRDELQAAIASFKGMSDSIKLAGDKLGKMSDQFGATANVINQKLPGIMAKADNIANSLDKKLPDTLDNFSGMSKEISDTVKENRKPLSSALTSVDSFFGTGSETLKKVDKYLTKITQGQLEMAMRAEYQGRDGQSKSYLSADYSPAPTKHYLIDVVNSPDYTKMTPNGAFIEPAKHEKSKTYVSAQFAKRYDELRVRAGLIESTGGAGVDYYTLQDRLKLSGDIYDFNAVNDVRGKKAHAKISARYQIYKHVNLLAGYDNFLNGKAANGFVGAGVSFIDDDLKYLVGSSSSSFIK